MATEQPRLTLRLLIDQDVPALQDVYDQASQTFARLQGRPAAPDQAARDFAQAITSPERYQFGVWLDDQLIGTVDCKLADQEGEAHIGLLLLADRFADPALASLVARIALRWLAEAFHVTRVTAAVPAHDPQDITLYQSLGFDFTGEQYRRDLGDWAPRFLVMARQLTPDGT